MQPSPDFLKKCSIDESKIMLKLAAVRAVES